MAHPSIVSTYGPIQLRCEYHDNPIGLDQTQPRLSWQINEPQQARNVVQSAYQIQVAGSLQNLEWDKADLWDSGKVLSAENTHIVYAGAALTSRQRCYWRVRTWNGNDESSPWSQISFWEMGLLQQADWQAAWVMGPVRGNDVAVGAHPSPMLRRVLSIPGAVRQARLYVTAHGLYEMHVNGQRVGDDCFTPGWTDYHKRLPYQTYDVTSLVKQGDNVIGAMLGDGWYCGHIGFQGKSKHYGDEPALLAQLELEMADGRSLVVTSDSAWKVSTDGPIRGNDFFDGEVFDARLEIKGWCEPGFDDANWQPVRAAAIDWQKGAALVAGVGPRVKRMETVTSQKVTTLESAAGGYLFDLAQNFAGWVRLQIPNEVQAGTRITLRYGETMNPDGSLYVSNLRRAKATDVYISAGGAAVWEPRFTFHGFRYVEITLQNEQGQPITHLKPDTSWVTGIVLYSQTPAHGEFACSHELVNQLQHNIQWGQRSNFLEVPTDCPQRDERLGWTGDAQVFIRTACFNMDVASFFTKWLTDLDDARQTDGDYPSVAPDVVKWAGGPGWSDAGVICPWTMYQCFGDKRILERHYPSLQKYMLRLRQQDYDTRHNYGDWLHHDAVTPMDLLGVAFHAHALDLMSRIAEVLGKNKDAAKYLREFGKVRTLFQKRFVSAEGRVVGDTQTAYVLALRFNLLPDKLRHRAVEYLSRDIARGRYGNMLKTRDGHLSTGFLGVKDLNFALSEAGQLELAYQLLLTETYPSWLFPVKNGATTIWERWDGWTHDKGFQSPSMNSFNHYAYGAIGQWLYQVVAGIDVVSEPGKAGYRHALIHPQPDPQGRITWARASTQTMHGLIASHWRIENGTFTLDVTIPNNTRATVRFRATSLEQVTESDQPVTGLTDLRDTSMDAGDFVTTIGSGTYRFATGWQ